MAQPKQETSLIPAQPPDASDALGAQVDTLLDELEQAADSLRVEAGAEPPEHAPADAAEVSSADDSAVGFEQSMFTKPPPAGAPSTAKSESRAKDPPLVKSSGGSSGKVRADERLNAENDSAPKHQEAPSPDERRTSRALPLASPDEPETEKQRSSEIKKLDEHLADTASNHLDEEVETLLNQGLEPGDNPESPDDLPSATASDEVDTCNEAVAPAPPASQPPAASPGQTTARQPSTQPEPATAPSPACPEDSPAESLSDSRVVVLVGDEPTESNGSSLILRVGMGVLHGISAPLSIAPVGARDVVGYLALVTLFNAAALWTLLLLRN